jgi:predicted metal-dependent hydrolase
MFDTIYLILIIFILYIYKNSNEAEVILTEAFENGEAYLVRNVLTKKEAANMLHLIKKSLIKLINKILNDNSLKKHKFYNYMKKINLKLKTVKIRESSPKSIYTSYSVNKGEELVFCIRSKLTDDIHDLNDLLYVAIHEIAHIGCPEVGHTTLFKEINLFLLEKSVDYKIYNYKNYNNNPIEYCGIDIKSTILN